MPWHEMVAALSGLQAAVWLFNGVRNKAEAIHAGWSDQTRINVILSSGAVLAVLALPALTFGLWLPPILQHFA